MGFKDLYKQKPKMPPRVAYNDSTVSVSTTRDEVESLTWDALQSVRIRTTSQGPQPEDVFWVLAGADGTELRIPSQAQGMARLLERLQQLPGFDHNAVMEAVTCSDDQGVVCWQRPGAEPR